VGLIPPASQDIKKNMMIYTCKKCKKEIALNEINFEGVSFCECGGMELDFKRTSNAPKKETGFERKVRLTIQGVKDYYK